MSIMKQSLKALVAAIGIAGAMSANAYVVGGINFGSALGAAHLETATLAQTFVNGNGQSAISYGYVSTVNGNANYCAGGGSCGLYYITTLSGSQNFSGTTVEFTNAVTTIYFNNSFVNLFNQDSVANLAAISGMTSWLTLSGHGNLGGGASSASVELIGTGTLTGATLGGTGRGLFDVDFAGAGLADVMARFDTNTVGDASGGFADVQLNSSFDNFVLNQFDEANHLADGCHDGTAAVGAWCYQGTTNLRGSVLQIPEPTSVALVGLSLGIVGFVSRRRSAAK
ncbi:MAG: hypothetical protein DI603_16760 [Roseateles depolymerans]|uniref:Ice-binding protein C-terminal domain-containing protein n=1 Tax=Roseateles depolymerans TaxID=76731 RepID=A0A2W5DMP5_9BURK|nr:MAG: hypothetical protein DI603_16760 [Roseateles depolymerans]